MLIVFVTVVVVMSGWPFLSFRAEGSTVADTNLTV